MGVKAKTLWQGRTFTLTLFSRKKPLKMCQISPVFVTWGGEREKKMISVPPRPPLPPPPSTVLLLRRSWHSQKWEEEKREVERSQIFLQMDLLLFKREKNRLGMHKHTFPTRVLIHTHTHPKKVLMPRFPRFFPCTSFNLKVYWAEV